MWFYADLHLLQLDEDHALGRHGGPPGQPDHGVDGSGRTNDRRPGREDDDRKGPARVCAADERQAKPSLVKREDRCTNTHVLRINTNLH